MIHPHYGYLASFKTRGFSFEELHQHYQDQLVSSYERALGQELLGDELACLSYWLIVDKDKKGYFEGSEVNELL